MPCSSSAPANTSVPPSPNSRSLPAAPLVFTLCLLDRHGSADAAFHQMTIERACERDLAAIRSGRPRSGAPPLTSEDEPAGLRPVHGLLLVQDRLPIRTDDAEADKIAGLDAEDIHPEDQRRRGRWERPVRNSAAPNRLHIRLAIPETPIVEGHVFIGNARIRTPERFLLNAAAGALGLTRKGIDHASVAPDRQVHMGKLGLP